MNKEIEEAIRKCNLYIQGGVMHLVDCNSKGQVVFKEYDTSPIETVLNYIKELEEDKKITELTKISCCTSLNCGALENAIREGLENDKLKKDLADSIPKSVIREKMKEIKIKGNEDEKTKENVMFYQGYYIALEEILKEGEK